VKVIVTVTVIIGVIFIGICTYLLWRWSSKQKGKIVTVIFVVPDPLSLLFAKKVDVNSY
jgi:predicted transporter